MKRPKVFPIVNVMGSAFQPQLSPATWDLLAKLEREMRDGGKNVSRYYALEHAVLLRKGLAIDLGEKTRITVRGMIALRQYRLRVLGKPELREQQPQQNN